MFNVRCQQDCRLMTTMKSLRKEILLSLILGFFQCLSAYEGVFEPEMKYTYSYEAKMYTGAIYPEKQQFAGSALRGSLTVQNINGQILFKLNDLKLGVAKQKPLEVESDLEFDFSTVQQEKLNKAIEEPFVVAMKDGIIKTISFEDGSKHERETIHWRMAIGELFQGDFERLRMRENENSVADKDLYEKEEGGIGGLCSTTYKRIMDTSNRMMKIIKTRHYDRCSLRPHLFHSSIIGTSCKSEQSTPYQAIAQVVYSVQTYPNQFLTIEQITGEGLITLTPFGSEGFTAKSVVNQTLLLLKKESTHTGSLPVWEKTMIKTSLTYLTPHDEKDAKTMTVEDLKKTDYHTRSPLSPSPSPNRAHDLHPELGKGQFGQDYRDPNIRRMFAQTKRAFPTLEDEQAIQYEKIVNLIDHFKRFNYNDFVQFFRFEVDYRTHTFENIIAYSVLPFVGTSPAILYFLNRIKDGSLHPLVAVSHLINIPFHVKEPSPALLQFFWDYLSDDVVKDQEILRSPSYLAFGSLLYRGCVRDDFTPSSTFSKTYADQDTCIAYLKKLIKAFQDESTSEGELLFLRTIKNSRLDTTQTRSFFRDVMLGNYRPVVKREALLAALEIFGKRNKVNEAEWLYTSAENIFLDTSQDYVVRMAAFEVVAKTVPTKDMAKKIVWKYMAEEKNQKVAGFMYSTLEFLANSTIPCNQIFASLYGDALRSVVPVTADPLKHGLNKYYSYFNDFYNVGHTTHIQTIAANVSILPVGMYLKHSMNVMGYDLEKIEIGNYVYDMSYLVDTLLNLLGKLQFLDKGPIPRILPWKHLQNVKERPQAEEKEIESYVSIYNQDVWAIYWQKLVQQVASFAGESPYGTQEVNYHGNPYVKRSELRLNFYYEEVEYIVPNELGIPVVLSLIEPGKAASQVNVKSLLYTREIQAEMNIGYFSGVQATMAVHSVHGQHGVRLKTLTSGFLPLKFDLMLQEESMSLKTAEPFDAFSFDTTPSTFYDGDFSAIEAGDPVEFDRRIGHDYFGVGASVRVNGDRGWIYQQLMPFVATTLVYPSDVNKLYAFSMMLRTLLHLNPVARPMSLNVRIEPSTENPSKTFVIGNFLFEKRSLPAPDFKVGFSVDGYDTETHSETHKTLKRTRHWDVYFKTSSDESASKKTGETELRFSRERIPNYDSNKFEVCLNAERTLKKMSLAFLEPTSRKVNPELLYNLNLKYGTSCNSEDATSIHAKVTGKVRSQSESFLNNVTHIYGERCHRNIKLEDIEFCLTESAKTGKMDEFRVEVKYENIFRHLQDKLIYLYMRDPFYSDEELEAIPILDGEVILLANRSFHHEEDYDVTITRPLENDTKFSDHVALHHLTNPTESQSAENIGRFNTGLFNSQRGTCYFSADQFSTFDEVRYKYDLDDEGYVVVMTHCPTQHFAIRIRKTEGQDMQMVINIGTFTITVTPNKQQVERSDAVPPRLSMLAVQDDCTSTLCTLKHETMGVLVSVQKTDDYEGYFIHSKQLMLDMFFNGKIGIISTSDLYRGNLCGLCGNFDGEKVDELMGPDRTVYKSTEEFVRSYYTPT